MSAFAGQAVGIVFNQEVTVDYRGWIGDDFIKQGGFKFIVKTSEITGF